MSNIIFNKWKQWILKKERGGRLGVCERLYGGRGIWGHSLKDKKNFKGGDNGKSLLIKRRSWV